MEYSVFTPVLTFWIQKGGQMFLPKTRMISLWMIAWAVACLPLSSAEAQTKLRWKFQEGETLNYVMTQDMTSSMNLMGQDIQTKMKQDIEMSWTVDKLESDGSAKMTQKFTRIRFKMTMPPPLNQTIEYDSKDGKAPGGPIGNLLGGVFAAMAKAETRFTIDPLGNISDYKIPEEVLKQFKQIPGAGNMGGMFSEEGLKQMASQGILAFPTKSLSNGDTWNKKAEIKMPFGTMKMKTQYTYSGKTKNGLDTIRSNISISMEPGRNAQIQIKLKKSDSSGKILFDNKAGRVRESNLEQSMVMEITAGGMVIEQETNTLTTMKLVTGDSKSRE